MKSKMPIYCCYKKCDKYPLKWVTYPDRQHQEMTCAAHQSLQIFVSTIPAFKPEFVEINSLNDFKKLQWFIGLANGNYEFMYVDE